MLPFSDGYTDLRQHFSQRTAWLCIPEECGEAILRAWISRRRPIRVIFSVSVSSSVLTQLPEDGEPARFNHPFTQTQTMMIAHAAERQVPGRSAATALIPHHITRLRLGQEKALLSLRMYSERGQTHKTWRPERVSVTDQPKSALCVWLRPSGEEPWGNRWQEDQSDLWLPTVEARIPPIHPNANIWSKHQDRCIRINQVWEAVCGYTCSNLTICSQWHLPSRSCSPSHISA